jgi:two-component system KDP operon response regulator KdpE
MNKKVLTIDDDPGFLNLVDNVLSSKGFKVFKASGGQEGLKVIYAEKPDMVILDVAMPEMDGWQTCRRIRDIADIPIIMLTGKQKAEEDIVRGLDFGADEYLFKPVGNSELIARVRAVLRRQDLPSTAGSDRRVYYADGYLVADITNRKVTVNGERVKLTPREFSLLANLVENANRVLTHRELLEKVWGWEYADDLDYVRIYISHLRQKIEPDPSLPVYILTEPGVGYYFQTAGS